MLKNHLYCAKVRFHFVIHISNPNVEPSPVARPSTLLVSRLIRKSASSFFISRVYVCSYSTSNSRFIFTITKKASPCAHIEYMYVTNSGLGIPYDARDNEKIVLWCDIWNVCNISSCIWHSAERVPMPCTYARVRLSVIVICYISHSLNKLDFPSTLTCCTYTNFLKVIPCLYILLIFMHACCVHGCDNGESFKHIYSQFEYLMMFIQHAGWWMDGRMDENK